MRTQDNPLVLTRLTLERDLLPIVVDLLTSVRYQLTGKLGHDIVALAQSLSSDLHTDVTHRLSAVIIRD